MKSTSGNPDRREFLRSAVLSGASIAAGGIDLQRASANDVNKPLGLVKQGKSVYSILVAEAAPPVERRAAAELQKFLEEMTGARLPIVTDGQEPDGPLVLIGDSKQVQKLGLEIPFAELGREGFVLRTVGKTLVIAGGKPRGTLYGVYTFLDHLGCRWFTPEVSVIPRRPTLAVKPLSESHNPAFEYREPFFTEGSDKDWGARNRVNGASQRLDESTGGAVSYFPFVHSFYAILPPQQYFQDHPEYYALVDGTRRGSDAQLCLTHPDVLRLTIQRVLQWISEHPDASIFSVSQNDTQGWCECENCQRVEREEGGAHSGPILRFVNAVAVEVGKTHPDKLIDTLAYWYSEPPPLKVRPAPNVRVRLCPIGACEAHAYEQCEYDRYFLKHLQAWAKITDQLYIWHYVTNFAHYLMPFPDFDELTADIPLYKRSGVVGIFLEGDASRGGGGENAELRSYVMARLLWNPDTDVDETVNEFMAAYYGKAARPMRAYFDLQHRQVRPAPQGQGNHLWIFIHPGAPYLSPAFLTEATKLLGEAESAAGDEATRRRVRKARLSIDYVKMIHAKAYTLRDGVYAPKNLDELQLKFHKVLDDARSFGIAALHEGGTLQEAETLFERHIKPYRVATLENSSLRVVVAPELTGRIVSIVDKASNTELVRQPDPGERTYPDASGVAVFACAGYLQAKTYDAEWRLEEPAGPHEVRLVGTCADGLRMQRTVRLLPGNPILHTESKVENIGSSPLPAVLSARFEAFPRDLKKSQLRFQSQSGSTVRNVLLTPDTEPAGTIWYADSDQPDGEWTVTGEGSQMAVVNRFPKEQVKRASVNWSAKADRRVTLNVWSAQRKLAPGEILTLETDYEFRAG